MEKNLAPEESRNAVRRTIARGREAIQGSDAAGEEGIREPQKRVIKGLEP